MSKSKRQAPSAFKRPGSQGYTYDFHVAGERFRGSVSGSLKEANDAVERIWRAAREAKRLSKVTGNDLIVVVQDRNETANAKNSLTVREVLAKHWNTKAAHHASAPTIIGMMRSVVSIIGKDKLWKDLNNDDISTFVAERYAMGSVTWRKVDGVRIPVRTSDISGAGINRHLTMLKAAYHRARDEWELETRPIKWSLHWQDEDDCRVRALTEDESRRLLEALPAHIRINMMLAMLTGMRKNELYSLTWDRVDFDAKTAHVIAKGKKGKTRPVPLGKSALALLQSMGRPERREDWSRVLVCDSTNHVRHWRAALKATGIPDFRWHDLRHTFATWLGRVGGVKLEAVSKALGHSSLQTTMRYRHVFADEVQKAVDAFPQIVEPKLIVGIDTATSDDKAVAVTMQDGKIVEVKQITKKDDEAA